jgi:hypothetical protein
MDDFREHTNITAVFKGKVFTKVNKMLSKEAWVSG